MFCDTFFCLQKLTAKEIVKASCNGFYPFWDTIRVEENQICATVALTFLHHVYIYDSDVISNCNKPNHTKTQILFFMTRKRDIEITIYKLHIEQISKNICLDVFARVHATLHK